MSTSEIKNSDTSKDEVENKIALRTFKIILIGKIFFTFNFIYIILLFFYFLYIFLYLFIYFF